MLKTKMLIMAIQKALIEQGERLTADGELGQKTQDSIVKYEITAVLNYPDLKVTAKKRAAPVLPVIPPVVAGDKFGAPWVFANIDLLGRDETDELLNARYVPEWKKEGLNYKTLSGARHAWCSVRANADRRKVGVSTTDSAAASSWSRYGKKCPFWFGAALDIKHKSGGRHICEFLYWIDEKKKIAATLDGNRGNKFCVAQTDLSGKGDVLVSGPRWPNEMPDGQTLTKEQVLKAYPYLKVGGSGSSTTR